LNERHNSSWKRRTAAYMTSQAITLFGSSITQFAIVWFIAKTTASGVWVTLTIVCAFAPQVVISLFAGVWADRYNRKLLIMLADAGIAAATLILAFLMLNGFDFLWIILIISGIRSLGAGIQTPAVSALIPQLVPEDKLMKVNGINGSVQSMVNLAAPAVAGAVLSYGEIYYILLIDVVTAVVGIGVLSFVPIPMYQKAAEKMEGGYFADLKEGLRYSLGNRFIRQLMIISIVYALLIVPCAFLNVLMVTRTFGDSYWYLTLNEMLFFVGAAAGGLLIGAWGGFKNRVNTLSLGLFAFGALTLIIGFIYTFWIYLIIMFLIGVSMPLGNTPFMTMLQENVEPGMQGRVFGLYSIVFSAFLPIGTVIFGPLADVVPIQWLMIGSGAALMLLAVFVRCHKSFFEHGMS